MEEMKYFEVEEGRIKAPIETHYVASDGSWCSGGEVLEDEAEILLWYRVIEYNEDGTSHNVVYYNVCDDGEHSNADEVLKQIYEDHQPDMWQNHDW
jgi:hypothetical protein